MLTYATSLAGDGMAFYAYEVWDGAFATMPDSFRTVINRCLREKPDSNFIFVPFGKRQETVFQIAPQYAYNASFTEKAIMIAERAFLLTDTIEEATMYYDQLSGNDA